MWNVLWPVLLVVGANTLYNVCAKSTPAGANAFASLSVTYFLASVLSVVLYYLTGNQKNLLAEFSKVNWTSAALALAIIGLEFGYINLYRVGWKVSVGSLVANISLACVLLVVGLLFYKEAVSLRQMVGMLVCAVGLFLITK